jgi:hypothetical protein
MIRMRMTGSMLCALFVLTVSAGAEAQGIGGLIKKKVEDVKKGDQPDARSEQQKSSFHNADVLPITKTMLDGLKVGITTEIRLRREFRQMLVTSYKTPDQYNACVGEVGMSPEGQKILNLMSTLKDPITPADIQRVTEKMDTDMKALVKQKCGGDVNFDWPMGKRATKLEEIEAQAAAAVNPSSEEPVPDLDGSSENSGAYAAEISVHAYQVLKERIVPFCMAYEKGTIKIDGKPVAIPGSGRNIYWLFTAEEAAYLAPRCKELMALLEQLL